MLLKCLSLAVTRVMLPLRAAAAIRRSSGDMSRPLRERAAATSPAIIAVS